MAASFPIPVKRSFYITLSLLIALIAFVGFWPSYFGPLLSRTVDTETVIHFHATIYVGWLLIFFTQATFAATGRLALHRKLGSVGIGYGVLIIIVGLFTTFSRFAGHVAEFGVEESLGRLHWPLTDMVLFSAFFGCAVAYRRKPEIHKRFMIVATTTLLVAAAIRMQFQGNPLPQFVFLGIWLSPILVAMAYDFRKWRLVHPVYLMGVLVLSVSSFRDVLMLSETWRSFTRLVARLVS